MVEYTTENQTTMTKEEIEKLQLEAFGIIVTKRVDIALVLYCHGANHYNVKIFDGEAITEDEYLKVRQAINVYKNSNR